jgi:conjugal transfer/entry exclusion protein
MAQSADGRMEALQVLADINDQQVQQLMKLRAIMLADMSSKRIPGDDDPAASRYPSGDGVVLH